MKTISKFLSVASLLFVTATAMAAAPVIGTWHINLAKSKFSPGPAPKSDVRTYRSGADGTTMTWKSTSASGKEMTVTSTFRTDGKDYPVTGTPNFDTLTLKQVDPNTVHSVQKKGGKVIGESKRSVSKDGKELTLKSKGMGADGVPYDNVMVYDRT
jgi:hypothetical protein